jgi:ATPase subunit of ABC transporter with duplicated ATPase domains
MSTEIQERCNTIEECYEFTLSYAAQGLPSDEGSESGKQVRQQLARAVEALSGLEESCAAAIKQEQLAPAEKYEAFFAVLARDAQSSVAAIELVLAQPAISSQLIDNLNASMHLRALLADLFLVTEILELQQSRAKAMVSN